MLKKHGFRYSFVKHKSYIYINIRKYISIPSFFKFQCAYNMISIKHLNSYIVTYFIKNDTSFNSRNYCKN